MVKAEAKRKKKGEKVPQKRAAKINIPFLVSLHADPAPWMIDFECFVVGNCFMFWKSLALTGRLTRESVYSFTHAVRDN